MNANNLAAWTRSSRCGSSTCVEAAATADRVLLRDGKNPDQTPIVFDREAWAGFLADIESGHFDRP